MTQENLENIKKQIHEIHSVADPAVCMMADQNPDKMCREEFELYKDKDGKFQMRLIGISLTDKNNDENVKNGTMEDVFNKLNLK